MKKEEYEELDKRIQEYIKYCIELGVIDENNKENITDRLSRTIIESVYGKPYGGVTYLDGDKIKVEICEDTLTSEAKAFGRNIEEYIDENVFHELTHASSILDNEIKDKMAQINGNSDEFPNLKDRGYDIINEYIAQSFAQKMVKHKYNNRELYPVKHRKFIYNENGKLSDAESFSYEYDSDLFWYGELEEFALKFIESVYGKIDEQSLYKDHFSGRVIEKAMEVYSQRNNGMDTLRKIFGNMSNMIEGDYYQQGYISYNEFCDINIYKNAVCQLNEIFEKELSDRSIEN